MRVFRPDCWHEHRRVSAPSVRPIVEQPRTIGYSLIAILLGRLQMDIDSCIEQYIEMSKKAFQKHRVAANLFGRASDTLKARGAYSTAELEKVVKTIVGEKAGGEDAEMVTADGACKV
jgi:hypothetical protein